MSTTDSSSAATSDKLGESPAVDLTGKVMVVIIIVLFMVVVCVLFVHLYAKVFWWRRHSRPRSRRFVVASGAAVKSGLDPSVLKSLPVSVFKPQQDLDLEEECSVCLSEVVEGEKVRLLPKCNHRFHVDCIDMWFQSHATCPLCRASVASSDDEPNPNAATAADNSESPQSFPTNVLIWGDHSQISSTAASLELEETTTSSSSSSATNRPDGMLVIDIPPILPSREQEEEENTSSSASRFAEDELKSPVIRSLRSLRRLLSNNRLNPWNPTSTSTSTSTAVVEQAAGKGGSEQN